MMTKDSSSEPPKKRLGTVKAQESQSGAPAESRLTPTEVVAEARSGEHSDFQAAGGDSTSRRLRKVEAAMAEARRELEQSLAASRAQLQTAIAARQQAEFSLEQSESWFRTAQDISLEGFTILRAVRNESSRIVDFEWLYANPAAGRYLRRPPDALIGQRLLKLLPGNQRNRALFGRYVRIVESGQGDEVELEYRADDINGWFRNLAVKLGDGLAVSFADISDQKRAEVERQQLEEQHHLLDKSESLRRMAGAIAHHFNNQLQAVIMGLELASSSLSDAEKEAAEFLNGVKESARKAAEVSTLMLTYLGQTRGKQEALDLAQECRLSLEVLRATMPAGVELETHLPADGPVVNANRHQIQQVLGNLMTNAWESLASGQGRVVLGLSVVNQRNLPTQHRVPVGWKPQAPTYACLEVADTGCGIAEADLERLFEPFFTSKFTGRGLGLSVVTGIAQAHRGCIAVESQTGRGSVFRFFLPIVDGAPGGAPARPEQPGERRKGGVLLLVEDDPNLRSLVAVILTQLGHEVLQAKDGLEAIEVFRQHLHEIRGVILDVVLPRLDGWAVLDAMREATPELPVIMTSGYDETEAMSGMGEAKPDAFLGKPYDLDSLRATLDRVLGPKT